MQELTVPIVVMHFVSQFIPISIHIKTSKQIYIAPFPEHLLSVHRSLFNNCLAFLETVYISDHRDK